MNIKFIAGFMCNLMKGASPEKDLKNYAPPEGCQDGGNLCAVLP